MKTDDLINLLANGPDLASPPRPGRARWLPLVAAIAASALLMVLLLGVRRDLAHAATLPAFWVKVLFVAALALVARAISARLAVPGARLGWLPLLLVLPVLLLWCLAGVTLADAAPAARGPLFWGSTWRWCPLLITLLSLPIFAAALGWMRQRAPTRLRLAGGAAGLAAGATAATLYCLHCTEMSSVFVGFWYLLGMLIPAVLGALIGPRVLRW